MKYFKTYITVLFAALLLHSCTESEIVQEIGPDEEGKVYITLSIPLNGGSSTRTEGDEYDLQTPAESKISTIRLVLVNKEDRNKVYEISSGDMNWSASGNVYTSTIPLTGITLGTYYAYVIANATPNGISLPMAGKLTYQDIDKAYTLSNSSSYAAGMDELSKANYFLMVNKNNLPVSDFRGGVEATLTSTNGINNPVHIVIDLERLACKVSVGDLSDTKLSIKNTHLPDAGGAYYTIDGLNLTGIGLLNCANQYNLIQHWKQGSNTSDLLNLLLQSPSTLATDDSYLATGYYNRLGEYITNPALFKSSAEVLYCMENNSPYYEDILSATGFKNGESNALPGTRMKGRTTGIIFRMQAHIKRGATSNEDINEDDLDPAPWEETSKVNTRASLGAQEYTTFYLYKGILYANNSALIAADSSLKGKTPDGLRQAGVEVYENGNMYYIYWIKDNYYNDGEKTYYSVMRNVWYHVAITDVKTIGSDIPGGKDYNEKDPIDAEVRDISVSLKCAKWQLRKYENEIK